MRAIRAWVLLVLMTVLGGGASLSAERASPPAPMPPTPGRASRTARGPGAMGAKPKQDRPPRPDKGNGPDKGGKRGKSGDTAVRGVPAGMSLDRTYSNQNYGLSIRYPASWTFKDQTATMTPKSEGAFRLVFGAYPIEKSPLVVNVRRVKLEAGCDADRFAAYNSYVKKWESKTVLGSPAFATTSRMLRPKPATVHRLIIIKDGCAWMLNCTDHTRKAPEESLGLFEAMVATISTPGP